MTTAQRTALAYPCASLQQADAPRYRTPGRIGAIPYEQVLTVELSVMPPHWHVWLGTTAGEQLDNTQRALLTRVARTALDGVGQLHTDRMTWGDGVSITRTMIEEEFALAQINANAAKGRTLHE